MDADELAAAVARLTDWLSYLSPAQQTLGIAPAVEAVLAALAEAQAEHTRLMAETGGLRAGVREIAGYLERLGIPDTADTVRRLLAANLDSAS